MERRKLLIADGNEAFCATLMAALQDEFSIRIAFSGKEAMALLDSFRPEVLVTDVMLPEVDGIRLLEYAAKQGHKLKTLVTMLCRSEYIFEKLSRLQVSYVMLKPCNMKIAAQRVREIAAELAPVKPRNPEELLPETLRCLGFNPKHNGYHYLATAVKLYWEDPDQTLTKELYKAVGAIHGADDKSVERCIRTAVESAWNRRNELVWRQYFTGTKRPTNGEMISGLAERLPLEKIQKFG